MNRVKWTQDEIESLAACYVKLRLRDPFAFSMTVLKAAQEETLIPEKRRHLSTVNYVPYLKERILALYALAAQAEPPPPQIIEMPVEKPVDYVEITKRLDLATLLAMLGQRFTDAIAGLRVVNEGMPAPGPTKAISILAPPPVPETPRRVRVAYCTGDSSLFNKVRDKVDENKIEVDLRWVDISRHSTVTYQTADFVLFPKKATGGKAHEDARKRWNPKRVKIIENAVDDAIRALFDIVSLHIHVPAENPKPARQAPL